MGTFTGNSAYNSNLYGGTLMVRESSVIADLLLKGPNSYTKCTSWRLGAGFLDDCAHRDPDIDDW